MSRIRFFALLSVALLAVSSRWTPASTTLGLKPIAPALAVQAGPMGPNDLDPADDPGAVLPGPLRLSGRIRSGASMPFGSPDLNPQAKVLAGMACGWTAAAARPGPSEDGETGRCFSSWARIAGTPVLEGPAETDSVFVFQMGGDAADGQGPSILTIQGGRGGLVRRVVISITPGDDVDPEALPDPAAPNDSEDPSRTPTDLATFRFDAGAGTAGGRLVFLNHVTGLDVEGQITQIEVLELSGSGSPRAVRFTGACDDPLPACAFSVLVEDRGDPVRTDDFGIAVAGFDGRTAPPDARPRTRAH